MTVQLCCSRPSAPWKSKLIKSLDLNKSLIYSRYVQLATVKEDGRPSNRTVVYRGFLGESDHITFVTDRRSQKVEEIRKRPYAEICWYFPETREQYRLSGVCVVVQKEGTLHPLTSVTSPPPLSPQEVASLAELSISSPKALSTAEAPHASYVSPLPSVLANDAFLSANALAEARQRSWSVLSDPGRSQFSWPAPKLPKDVGDLGSLAHDLGPAPGVVAGGTGAAAAEKEAAEKEAAEKAAAAAQKSQVEAACKGVEIIAADAPAPDSFCLVVFCVDEVDHVQLLDNRRTLYASSTSYQPTSTQAEATAEADEATAAAAAAAAAPSKQWMALEVFP